MPSPSPRVPSARVAAVRGLGLGLVATLGLVAAACGDEGGGAPTCGVAGATQSCVCSGGEAGAQSCQADGAWGACDCVPAACEGVSCLRGGVCVVEGGAPRCDCPPSTFGGDCGGFCPTGPLEAVACNAPGVVGQWYAIDPAVGAGQAVCERAREFAFRPEATASRVELWFARKADLGSQPSVDDFTAVPMRDDDGDGMWLATALIATGEPVLYGFRVDGGDGIAPAPSAPLDGETGLSVANELPCEAEPERLACGALFGDGIISVDCPGAAAGCDGDVVSGPWFGVALRERRAVTEVRVRSDWHTKRPATWELWAADAPRATPASGARLVATGVGRSAPWQCVSGEPCDDPAVPDACCPDGRAAPQRIAEGALIPKWETYATDAVVGQYFFFRVVDTEYPHALILQELALGGHACLDTGGRFVPPECDPLAVGEAAGCAAGAWCAPGMGSDLATPACVAGGPQARGQACALLPCDASEEICAQFQCEAGLACAANLGVQFETCEVACDPLDPAATCPATKPVCVPATAGDATLPWGTCHRTPCEVPYGAGECPSGSWCSPVGLTTDPVWPVCRPIDAPEEGAACAAGCPEHSVCVDGGCVRLCVPPGSSLIGPACPSGTTCETVTEDIGRCE